MRFIAISFIGLLSACSNAVPDGPISDGTPSRVVSLDYCADQFVLKMIPRENILALSPDAAKAFSYLRKEAEGLPTVRALAEDVIILKPDIVVRSYGGGPDAQRFFEGANIPVVNVGWANDLDDVKRITQDMADALGVPETGEAMNREFDRRVAALPKPSGKSALYVTPSGVTSGSGSMVDEMMTAAGLVNFQVKPGWRSLPLERLAAKTPDVIAAAFFDTKSQNKDIWSSMRHPIAQTRMKSAEVVPLQGAWTSCGAWYVLDAVEALAAWEQNND